MAVETSPSLTSTSHTLTALPAMSAVPNGISHGSLSALLESLQPANRHTFIQPTAAISDDSLAIVKHTLEAFAGQVADDQQRQLQDSRKRKRGAEDLEVLKIRKVYVDGFETNQVWQQAKRIIGSVLKHADATLEELQDNNQIALGDVSGSESVPEEDEEELELGSEDDLEAGESDSIEHPDGVEGLSDIDSPEGEEEEEEEEWEDAPEGSDGEDDGEEEEDDEDDEEAEEYAEDPDGLNDGFFSLEDFNKQSQWFEEQDAKGDPNTDAASDDENIDWTADPLAPSKATGKSQSRKMDEDKFLNDGQADGDEEDDDDDDGPTFGDMALDAPEGDSEDEAMQGALEDGLEDGAMDFNANDVFYKDFFAPPKRKYNSDKPRKAKRSEPEQPAEGDMNRAMAAVRRDLFEDESEHEDSEDVLSDVSAGDPRSRRSAHERRQAKLAEEIRKLEAASVAKREWTLSGEAAAVDRPMNSLLEQDLDFEHVGKPVPVITPEVTEGIEDLIKRRILAQEFDEVLRRRPGTENVPNGTRRGLLEEVDDTKGKSLAEVYEEEHAKQVDPEGHANKSDEKLKKEEREVEAMWRDVSARLDALSSWQYRPRPVEPTLSVVADVATVSMEDAQPTTAQGVVGEQSRMAPQEIYSASGKTAAKGEVVSRSGLPMAKQEMSREDKQRRRRREKERVRKAGGVGEGKTLSKRAKMQKETMADLKKGGVKVINRKGEVTDVDGNKVKAAKAKTTGSFKL